MPCLPATAPYDEIADWYDESVRANGLLTTALLSPTLQHLTGSLNGRTICDLACGQGVLSRFMAERGADVTGIDLSERLLDFARRDEAADPLGITYRRDDAQVLTTVSDAAFDGVVCAMALMDIPDLSATLRTVHRVLVPGGWFVFVIMHPCFQSPPDTGYYAEGFWRSENPNGVRGKVGAYHRTLSTYVNALTEADLWLQTLMEPQLSQRPVPALLWARCERA